jgi:hypothetical protein
MKFTEVSRQARVTQPPHNGFVAFFAELDNDGWPHLLTTSLAPWDAVLHALTRFFTQPQPSGVHAGAPRLFRNNRDGTFTGVTVSAGLFYPMGTMGAGIADLDKDGRLDFYSGTGDPQLSRLEPNRFFRNEGGGTFSDATHVTGFARPGNKGYGMASIDIGSDGDLDVYAQLGGHYLGDHARNALDLTLHREVKGSEGFVSTDP